jgi:hypothetical protein
MGIRTYGNLNKKLNKLIKDNMKKITAFAYDEVVRNVQTYYDEYNPKRYNRTYQFKNSPYTEPVKEIGGTYFSQVGIDYQNMMYEYNFGDDGDTAYVFWADGEDVVRAANRGEHGVELVPYVSNNHFWDDALTVTWNDAVQSMFAREIRRKTGCDCQPVNGWLI